MQPSAAANPYLEAYKSSSMFGQAPVQPRTVASSGPKGPGGLKGFLINNLPAIGGGLGGVAGAFVPGLDATGASEIAGAAAGSALGEHIKQSLLGENKGNTIEQLKQDAIQGAEGGALQGAGRIIGGGMSAAKSLFEPAAGAAEKAAGAAAGAGADTGGNVVTRFLNKQATKSAQNAYADQVQQEFGHGGITQSTNGIPINQVLSNMQSHNIAPTVTTMSKYGNAGFAYNDVLNNAIVPNGVPVNLDLGKIVGQAMKAQPGLTVPKGFAGKLVNTITDSLDPTHENISGLYHPADLLKAAQDLYGPSAASGAEAKVYASARKALVDAAGKEGGLNNAIKSYKLPSVADAMGQDGANLPNSSTTQHILELSGHNPTLAQEIVDKINSSSSIQDIQKAELPHIAANEIAQSHAGAIGQSLPRVPGSNGYSLTGMGGLSTAYELGSLAHGNIAAAIPLAAKAGMNPIDRLAGKFGTADLSQVGPPKIPSLAGEEAGAAGAGAAPAPQVAPPAPAPNLMDRLKTGVQDIASNPVGAATDVAQNTAKFGARMVAAPAAYPVRTGMNVVKQGVGRTVGNVLMNGTPSPDQGTLPAGPAAGAGMAGGDANSILSGIDNAGAQGQDAQPQGAYTQQDMLSDIAQDPKNAATYESLYKMMNPSYNKPALSNNQQNSVLQIKDAATSVNNYAQNLSALAGATGVGTGEINTLLGKLGIGEANQKVYALESQRTDLATQLAKAVTGGKPSSTQIEFWKESLPSVKDSPSVQQDKLNLLARNLQGYLENANTPIGSGSTSSLDTSSTGQ